MEDDNLLRDKIQFILFVYRDKDLYTQAQEVIDYLKLEDYGRMVRKTVPPYPVREWDNGEFTPGRDKEGWVEYFERIK